MREGGREGGEERERESGGETNGKMDIHVRMDGCRVTDLVDGWTDRELNGGRQGQREEGGKQEERRVC